MVEFLVEGKLCRSGGIVRDHRDGAGFGDAGAEVISIIGCVGHDDAGLLSLQQRCRLGSIALLAGGQMEGDGAPQAAHSEMDFGAQAAARTSESLIGGLILSPLFAPAAC